MCCVAVVNFRISLWQLPQKIGLPEYFDFRFNSDDARQSEGKERWVASVTQQYDTSLER